MRQVVVLLTLVFLAGSVGAAEDNLKNIMQGLGNNFVQIIESLLTGDRDQLIIAAEKIAQHPEIPEYQRILIAAELENEMPQFARFDQMVHSLSLELQKKGLTSTEQELRSNTQEMLSACLACHTAYKSRVSSVLER